MSTKPPSSGPVGGVVDPEAREHEAILVVGFGGPEGPGEVLPFLQRVTAGRGIPDERLVEVGAHYALFGGVSPINGQTRALVAAIADEVARRDLPMTVHWGNRNAAPFVEDAVASMAADGVRTAVFVPTSSFSSYSGCRQYREDVARACSAIDGDAAAPTFDRLRQHGNHPGFVEPMGDRLRAALAGVPEDRRDDARILFTAHSIPTSMAATSLYEQQLRVSAGLVMAAGGVPDRPWELVFQSRSGPPQMPWLEPDVGDRIEALAEQGMRDVVVVPLGFISDHVEVLYDLDVEAQARSAAKGVHMVRAKTVGTDPRFVRMIVDLVVERRSANPARAAVDGSVAPHDVCFASCCPNLRHPGTPAVAQVEPPSQAASPTN